MSEKNPGRPIGAVGKSASKRRNAAEKFAAEILDSEEYRCSLIARAHSGTLAPAIEKMLWAYRFGVPVKKVEISTPEKSAVDYSDMDDQMLANKLKELTELTLGLGKPN